MTSKQNNNLITDNRGETLVEVTVAFIVLMIVIAMFTGVTRSAGAAVTNSIDLRRTYDSEYEAYRKELGKVARNSAYNSPMQASETKDITITTVDGTTTITAYQYTSGDSVYWVFR